MKLLVATITFAVTMGGLFFFDTTKTTDTAEKNYAQILEGLNATENPTTTPKTVAKKTAAPKISAMASATPTTTLSPTSSSTATPAPQESNYQITVISIASLVKQNSMAEVKIKTTPEAQCSIKVTLPSGGQSTAKGLETKTTDNSGAIAWSWRINWNTKPGTATIEIDCSKNAHNFSKTIPLEILE